MTSKVPSIIKGIFVPWVARLLAASEKSKIPIYAAKEYTPLKIPLVSFGKDLKKIESRTIFSIIDPITIKTQIK